MVHTLLVIAAAVALTQAAVLVTSIYLHRALAHHALEVHPLLGVLFRALLWLTTGQRRQEWVAVHRKHHKFTDREGDPHSPRLVGLWRVQFLNVYYYAREARNPETLSQFAPDLLDDRLERLVFRHGWVGIGCGTAALCLTLGFWSGVAAMTLHAALYVFVLAPLINGLGHWRGRKNYDNTAFNWPLLSWVTGGESLHNNHHAQPRAPKFSARPLEFDPSWLVIRALAGLRLITVRGIQLAPVPLSPR